MLITGMLLDWACTSAGAMEDCGMPLVRIASTPVLTKFVAQVSCPCGVAWPSQTSRSHPSAAAAFCTPCVNRAEIGMTSP